MTNLKGPPATSEARPTTSEGAWAFFFQIMPPCRQYIFKLVQYFFRYIVEIKKCANLQQKGYSLHGSPLLSKHFLYLSNLCSSWRRPSTRIENSVQLLLASPRPWPIDPFAPKRNKLSHVSILIGSMQRRLRWPTPELKFFQLQRCVVVGVKSCSQFL